MAVLKIWGARIRSCGKVDVSVEVFNAPLFRLWQITEILKRLYKSFRIKLS